MWNKSLNLSCMTPKCRWLCNCTVFSWLLGQLLTVPCSLCHCHIGLLLSLEMPCLFPPRAFEVSLLPAWCAILPDLHVIRPLTWFRVSTQRLLPQKGLRTLLGHTTSTCFSLVCPYLSFLFFIATAPHMWYGYYLSSPLNLMFCGHSI